MFSSGEGRFPDAFGKRLPPFLKIVRMRLEKLDVVKRYAELAGVLKLFDGLRLVFGPYTEKFHQIVRFAELDAQFFDRQAGRLFSP